MVTSDQAWEETTRKYLTQIQSELNAVDKEVNELVSRRDQLAREAEAYEVALDSYLVRTGHHQPSKASIRGLLAQQKNHKERLRIIAERNNGIGKVGAATDILYNSDLIRSKSRANAYRIVYGLYMAMAEDGECERIGPSTFKLSQQNAQTGHKNT